MLGGTGLAVATYQEEEFDFGWGQGGLLYVCLYRRNECWECLVRGGVDVFAVIDIFQLHEGIMSSEAPEKPPSQEPPHSYV